MVSLRSILSTVLQEHEFSPNESRPTIDELYDLVSTQLQDTNAIPAFSHASLPMTVVSFWCMLQDTSYPAEIYMPGDAGPRPDRSSLRERWPAWGVEIPGAQEWKTNDGEDFPEVDARRHDLPAVVHGKHPTAEDGQYLGALIKIYDAVSLRPTTAHRFIGVLSASLMPASLAEEEEEDTWVPSIHVIKIIAPGDLLVPDLPENTRADLLAYLSRAFEPPDDLAATLLLLTLISHPTARPSGMEPTGTLSVNFIRSDPVATKKLADIISSVWSPVVTLALSIPMLHSSTFSPVASDSSRLSSGKLQLVPGTVMLVDEDGMSQGGQLKEQALHNMRALAKCLSEQVVHYEYPYVDSLKFDCCIKGVIVSEGRSLLPTDVTVPLNGDHHPPLGCQTPDLTAFRQFLMTHSSASHASKFHLSDEVAQSIQDEFVTRRRARQSAGDVSNAAEANLKRQMRIARLLAISYPSATLSKGIWAQAVEIDNALEHRQNKNQARGRP